MINCMRLRRRRSSLSLSFSRYGCALHAWSDFLRDAQAMIYTDNDGVRDCLIACQTDSINGRPILNACLCPEFDLCGNFWYARVPTDSNIADWPSRNELEHLTRIHSERILFRCNGILQRYGGGLTSIECPMSKKICNDRSNVKT